MAPDQVHHGATAERLIRQSGYSLTRIAQELGIGRNTLYRRFEDALWSQELRLRLSAFLQTPFDLSLQDVPVPKLRPTRRCQALRKSYQVFVTLLAQEASKQVLSGFQQVFDSFVQERQAALEQQYVPYHYSESA